MGHSAVDNRYFITCKRCEERTAVTMNVSYGHSIATESDDLG